METHNLKVRLEKLSKGMYDSLMRTILTDSGVHPNTVRNVLAGRSQNMKVIRSISNYFEMRIDDVLNPYYEFATTKKNNPKIEQLATDLNLKKP